MGINHKKLSEILGSEIAGNAKHEYQWRPATSDDVGRLARFADLKDDDWSYGMIGSVDGDAFECVQYDNYDGEMFFICEVQEVIAR